MKMDAADRMMMLKKKMSGKPGKDSKKKALGNLKDLMQGKVDKA